MMASSSPHMGWHWNKTPTYIHDQLVQVNQLMPHYQIPRRKMELKGHLGSKPLGDKNVGPHPHGGMHSFVLLQTKNDGWQ